MTPAEIEHATFRPVAQCLNQQRHPIAQMDYHELPSKPMFLGATKFVHFFIMILIIIIVKRYQQFSLKSLYIPPFSISWTIKHKIFMLYISFGLNRNNMYCYYLSNAFY